jgi:hypothetical protein
VAEPDPGHRPDPVHANQAGQHGAFAAGSQGGRKAIQVVPGQDANGHPYNDLELYFSAGGVVPNGSNVLLCLEYYDSPAGVDREAQ